MYFTLNLVIFIIIGLFLFLQMFNILTEKTEIGYQKYLNLVIYIIFISTIIAILINIMAFNKTYKKTGIMGKKGVSGRQGKQGRIGRCNNKCGTNICYIDVIGEANNYFQNHPLVKEKFKNKNKTKIVNKAFINKINKICKSNQYIDILTKKHKKKPTDEKLIEYIKNIIKQWIDILVKHGSEEGTAIEPNGITFLTQPNLKFEDILNKKISNNLEEVNEIQLFDIWKWGEEPETTKLKFKKEKNKLNNEIEPDQAQLYIMNSNNYHKVYDATANPDEWDTGNCPYNQMGTKRDNPNNLDKCIYTNKKKFIKEYKPTWKNKVFNKPEEVSLYNTIPYKTDTNHEFFPVGSVWRGKNTDERDPYVKKSPLSSSKCGDGHGLNRKDKYNNKGPDKETILVSGDVTSPKDYKKIWDSDKKCQECQHDSTQIFRPIPQDGYTCLGDVAIPWQKDTTKEDKKNQRKELDNLNIKCIPSKCVRKKKLGPRVWNNMDLDYSQYNNYLSYTTRKPFHFNKQLNTSLWDAGNRDSGEEIHNRYGIDLKENGGYNLFRASQDYDLKPTEDSYVIKEECLMPARGKKPRPLEFNMGNLKEKGLGITRDLYNTSQYFDRKPQQAILTNYDTTFDTNKKDLPVNNNSIYGPSFNNKSKLNKGGKRKQFYLVDDNTKAKETDTGIDDSYFIKTFNEKKNDFSACLKVDIDDNVIASPICDYRNPAYKWKVKYDTETGASLETSGAKKPDGKNNWLYQTLLPQKLPCKEKRSYSGDCSGASSSAILSNAKIKIQSLKEPKKCLQNYYDKNGQNINKLVTC